MGYNNDSLADISPIVVDIETAPLLNARDYLEPPDLTDIQAPKNYVRPEAIAEYIAREKVKRVEEYETRCADRAALDWNVGRIVAMGWWTEQAGTQVHLCLTEEDEIAVLGMFWIRARHRTIVGFNIKAFDLRFMVRRSQLLGVPYSQLDFSRYSRRGVHDLYLDLTFNDGTYDQGVMRRTLHAFCKRFGIPVDDTIKGSDIPTLVANGEWEKVARHVKSDVEATVALARKLGVLPAVTEPVEEPNVF